MAILPFIKRACSSCQDDIIQIGFAFLPQTTKKADKIYEMMIFKSPDIRQWRTVMLWDSESVTAHFPALSFQAIVQGGRGQSSRAWWPPELRRDEGPGKSWWLELTGQGITQGRASQGENSRWRCAQHRSHGFSRIQICIRTEESSPVWGKNPPKDAMRYNRALRPCENFAQICTNGGVVGSWAHG